MELVFDLGKGEENGFEELDVSFGQLMKYQELTHWKDLGPEMDPLLGRFRDQLDLVVNIKLGFISQHPRPDEFSQVR